MHAVVREGFADGWNIQSMQSLTSSSFTPQCLLPVSSQMHHAQDATNPISDQKFLMCLGWNIVHKRRGGTFVDTICGRCGPNRPLPHVAHCAVADSDSAVQPASWMFDSSSPIDKCALKLYKSLQTQHNEPGTPSHPNNDYFIAGFCSAGA